MGLTRKQIVMLAILVSGTFITILNQTLVTPALPSIMAEMSIDASLAQWLTTGFTLVNAIMIPITAYLTDRFSTRALFIVSMSIFTAGSLLAGWGPNFPLLLTGRMIQAVGAGVLMPMVMTVMLLTFPVERRGMAMGWFGVIIAFAPAFGPTVAGLIVDHASWHFMFYLVTILSAIDIVFAIALLPKLKDGDRNVPALDKPSVILSSIGCGSLLFGFSDIGSSGASPLAFSAIAVGAVVLVVFFRRQLKLEQPMLRVQVLKNRRFTIGTVIAMIVQASIMANAVVIPIFVQDICGQTATTSGLVLLPGAIIMGAMGPIAGRIFDKSGPRSMALLGTALLAASTLYLTFFLNASTSMFVLGAVIAVRNFAMALVNMPITTWGINALDNKVVNHGNAVNNTLRQMAGSLGTAIIVTAYSIALSNTIETSGFTQASMIGVNVAFGVQFIMCAVATVLVFFLVKNKASDAQKEDPTRERRSVVEAIMHSDVYALSSSATIADAINLFIAKGISAAPIVDNAGKVVGVISDGDVVRALSRRDSAYMDPIILIMSSGKENEDFDKKLDDILAMNVTTICTKGVITVDAHANIAEICRVLGDNHLKKVPVVDEGKVIGVINRSDITKYALKKHMDRREAEAAEAQ